MTDLSIIILNYNTATITLKCLESIHNSQLGKYTVEVIVVDNASSDDSVARFKAYKSFIQANKRITSYRLIENLHNSGFSAGNNKGIRQAKGRYILLLNSDVILMPNTLAKTIKFMNQHDQYSVCTCQLVMPIDPAAVDLDNLPPLEEFILDPACHRGFPTPWASATYFSKLEQLFPSSKAFGQYHQGWKNLSKTHRIDAISGAYFFARRSVFEKIGLLDEGFFMYAEDLDLCLRAHQAGLKIAYYPHATAIHLKGVSGRKNHVHHQVKHKTNAYFWQTMKLFYTKHYANQYPKPFMWLIFKVIDWKSR